MGVCDNLTRNRPDFVFNIAEGSGVTRGRESQVPAVLESLNIPYSGSDPVALAVTLDKWLTHHILSAGNVAVPSLYMFSTEEDLRHGNRIFQEHGEYIVKPRWEGSSKGVFPDSVVSDCKNLAHKVRRIWRRYRQPALVEEFLPGEEITVGLVGNRVPRVIGMMAIDPVAVNGRKLYSIEHKRNWEEDVLYKNPESLDGDIRRAAAIEAAHAFGVLELRDVARVDFRVDEKGIPRVIDVNPLPGLSESYSDLPILYRMNGGNIRDLVGSILAEAFGRYGWVSPRRLRVKHFHAV